VTQPVELALDALYQIILPIFLVFGVGFVVGRKAQLIGPADKTLSKLVFYVFSPCLVFSSLATSDVGTEEIGQIGLFALVMILVTGAVAWALARLLRLAPSETGSLLLVSMFGNIGNYGLPLNELAFGQPALDRAVIYFVASSVLLFSLGVIVAARAKERTPGQALTRMVRVPVVHALWLAGLNRWGVLPVPGPILEAASLLAQGTVPLMLLILGAQLSRVQIRGSWRLVGLATGVRLLLAPLAAVLLAGMMGLTGLTEQVSIVEASMPSAVYTIILAVEFDLASELTSSVVFITTFISPLTLIPLISYLR
jgi:predicted permease